MGPYDGNVFPLSLTAQEEIARELLLANRQRYLYPPSLDNTSYLM